MAEPVLFHGACLTKNETGAAEKWREKTKQNKTEKKTVIKNKKNKNGEEEKRKTIIVIK